MLAEPSYVLHAGLAWIAAGIDRLEVTLLVAAAGGCDGKAGSD